jgi:electron transport complex protein RnfB
VCQFGAIKITDGIAIVIREKCAACGKCITACPKGLIEIVSDMSRVRVVCNSREEGRVVREKCRAGCIACGICQKLCKRGAITLEDNVAHINYDICILCMDCVKKCPTKAIKLLS